MYNQIDLNEKDIFIEFKNKCKNCCNEDLFKQKKILDNAFKEVKNKIKITPEIIKKLNKILNELNYYFYINW